MPPSLEREARVPITVHNTENLTHSFYRVEEHIFINCKLTNCRLFYDGGPFEFVNANFENCEWTFRESAWFTVRFLETIGMLKEQQSPPQTIPMISGRIVPSR